MRSTEKPEDVAASKPVEPKGEVADDDVLEPEMLKFESEEEKKQAVGNLVADDEWMGLSMELGELVRVAVVEDLKKNARDFLGKDEYKVSYVKNS